MIVKVKVVARSGCRRRSKHQQKSFSSKQAHSCLVYQWYSFIEES